MLQRRAKPKSTTFLLVLFFMQSYSSEAVRPMGSILFEDHGFAKKCFVQNDIALLSTRLKLQDLLPIESESGIPNDDALTAMIRYFYGINEIIEKQLSDDEIRQLVQKSFYDLLGSYLKHQILPVAKFSFYSGNLTYAVIANVLSLYERCKELLDTNGNGWSDPITDFSQFKTKTEPLDLRKQSSEDESMKACVNLAMNQNDNDNEEDMLVLLPKLEADENAELSTIWLPLKRKHIFNINSKSSAFILFRYFVLVTQCYAYQGINQPIFNQKLKVWLAEEVLPYLNDEKFYPAFGAALRILETVKEANESVYLGVKSKPISHRRFIGSRRSQNSNNNDEDSFETDWDEDKKLDWWIRVSLIASGPVIVLLLLMCMTIRICCKKKRKDAWTDPPDKPSLWQKFKNIFVKNAHRAEADEFYQYKKLPPKDRKQKSKKSGSNEKFDLPLLSKQTDTEEEDIVLYESDSSKNKGRKGTSDSSGHSKGSKNECAVRSEDEKLKKKKPLINSEGYSFKGQEEPTGVDFNRLLRRSRSKSPSASSRASRPKSPKSSTPDPNRYPYEYQKDNLCRKLSPKPKSSKVKFAQES